MKVMVFDVCGPLMKYKNMLLSWLDFYKDGFRYVRKELASNIISLSSTTHNYRNIDKNKQKWYNRSARKKAEKSKKACT